MSKLDKFLEYHKKRKKISCITAYDASMSKFLESQGVNIILVGDSLGQVIKGKNNTHDVTFDEIIYHTNCVKSGINKSLLMVDLPKDTYNTKKQALYYSNKILCETKADIVKLEVKNNINIIKYLVDKGIPICAHIGLLPQTIKTKSGFRMYGKTFNEADSLMENALSLDNMGVKIILLECVDNKLSQKIAKTIKCPVIGIGSGNYLDGQVAVIYDLLGISFNKISSLSKDNSKHIEKIIKNFLKKK
tara:strand:- start:459 stop:1199 length:741 start_codon:yes stop_codon:yes gene_type:complete